MGDFNYVFSPVIKLQRYFKGNYKDSICIIDECHNLPDRAREYYSPEITQDMIFEIMTFIKDQSIPLKLKNKITSTLQELDDYIEQCIISLNNPELRVAGISLKLSFFSYLLHEFEQLVILYVGNFVQNSQMEPMNGDE